MRKPHSLLTGRAIYVAFIVAACVCGTSCRSYVFQYPYSWKFAKTLPSDQDLAGDYVPIDLRIDSTNGRARIEHAPMKMTLGANHVATFEEFPDFNGFGELEDCLFTGTASWHALQGSNEEWQLQFSGFQASANSHANCTHKPSDMFFIVLGRNNPHTLYLVIGDPDSGTGVEFSKKSS